MRIEGITYDVDWAECDSGQSVFIPCLDGDKARDTAAKYCTRLNVEVVVSVRIEEGIRGLRIWKV